MLRNCWRYKCEDGRFANVNKIVQKAALNVSAIWARVIGDRLINPLLDQKVIEDKLKRLNKKGVDVSKNRRNPDRFNEFKAEVEELFDVCSCTCPSATCFQVHCKAKNCDGFHLACKCEVKVPKRKIQFLLDQRSARKMVIADIDRNVSRMWARAVARDETMGVAAKMEETQAEVRREEVQLDIPDESASEVGGNSRSGFDEDYVQTTIFDESSQRNLT